jgi:hypothetical protein
MSQLMIQGISVKVGEFSRTWKPPNIGKSPNLGFFQKRKEIFKAPGGMADRDYTNP